MGATLTTMGSIGKLLRMTLKPQEQLITLTNMRNLGLMGVSLHGTHEDKHVHPCVRKLGDMHNWCNSGTAGSSALRELNCGWADYANSEHDDSGPR